MDSLQTKTGRRFDEVSIVLVEPAVIKGLNRLYRRHDRVTDVLSFTYQTRPVKGDIIICLAQAGRQAKRYKHSLPEELIKLVIHGGLHLLGYDHLRPAQRTVMRTLEKQVGRQFGLSTFAEDHRRQPVVEGERRTLRSSKSAGGGYGGFRRRHERGRGRKAVEAS